MPASPNAPYRTIYCGTIALFQLLLISLLLAAPALANDAKEAEIAAKVNPDPSSLSGDVGSILHDARVWSGYGNDCRMRDLSVRERKLSEAHMNLMAMRSSTMGTIMEMGANLREIFAGMESMFPGGPTAYDYFMKPAQQVLDKAGPYGKVAKGVTDVLNNYKDWHNSEVAKDLSANVKRQAKAQIEALQEAVDRLKEIETAMDEVERMIDRVLERMQTFPQRCLKGQPITPPFLRLGEMTDWADIQADVFTELQKAIDDCDLEALINRLAYLNFARGTLEGQLEQKAGEIVEAFNALNAELEKFEGQLPKYEMKDFVGLLKAGEGLAASAAGTGATPATGGADFSGSKPSDFLPLEEVKAAMDKAEAGNKLKASANAKLEALRKLIKERDDIMETLLMVYKEQREIQGLIETWEERCLKEDNESLGLMGGDLDGSGGHTAVGTGTGTSISLGSDSPEWCSYREGNPTTYTPGGTSTPPSSGGTPTSSGGSPTSSGGSPASSGGHPASSGGSPTGTTPPKPPCPEELDLINAFLEKHGDALKKSARSNAKDASDLAKIEARKKELEEECGGSDPRDSGGSGSSGGSTVTGGGPGLTSVPRDPKDEPDDDDPRDTPTVVIYVKAKAMTSTGAQATAGQQIKLFAQSTTNVALPGAGVAKPQTDHDADPIQGVTDSSGSVTLIATGAAIGIKTSPTATGTAFEVAVDTTAQSSVNVQTAGAPQAVLGVLPGGLGSRVSDVNVINGTGFITMTFPSSMLATVQQVLIHIPGVVAVEINFCRDKQAAPDDPLYKGNEAWGQKYDNQWAIKRVGLNDSRNSAWNMLGDDPQPVTIAVIDTGLDWNHQDFDWGSLWQNPGEIRDNGIDDDGNGYVDDLIGWDFFARNNQPWDHDGHGTFVTGVIAAHTDNDIGMAGINPHARIMVLKALNSFGHTRASYLAKAITYAVDNGAQIINMSVGGKEMSTIERAAIDYATSKGVLVVVAAGNEGLDVSNYGIAGMAGVLTVAATDLEDKRAGFSNWGAPIDIAAPGMEVLGLRARRTDTMRDIPGVEYVDGGNYVGDDLRYYRASGTSFAAPIVAGVASLLLSRDPSLTPEQVKQILVQSAEDLEVPGVDQFTGYGMVDAIAALKTEQGYFIDSAITGVEIVQDGGATLVRVSGTANANDFDEARLELGQGAAPQSWKKVGEPITGPVPQGVLGDIDASNFAGSATWTLRVITTHDNGETREAWFLLELG